MENEATEQTQPEPEKVEAEKPSKAPREKPVERPKAEKPVFTTELSVEVCKYWNAPENQAKIAAFLKRIGFAADRLTDEHRYNFAKMIEGEKAG